MNDARTVMRPVMAPAPAGGDLRRVMARFATGITVVSAGRARPHGMTANSFTSVSLEPPLVLVCVQRNANMHQAIHDSGTFAISVLAAHQEQLARIFADRDRLRGEHEFAGVDTMLGPYTGTPVLSDALAWLECGLADVHDGGDHSIFIGRVETVGRGSADSALLFFDGGFHRLPSAETVPGVG